MLLYVYIISYNIKYIILWVYIVYKIDFMMQIDNFLPFWKRDKYRIKTPFYAWIINGSKLQVIGINGTLPLSENLFIKREVFW